MSEPDEPLETSFLHLKRPVLVGLFVLSCLICTWVLFAYGAAEWSAARRIAGGIVMGAICFLSLFINRLLIST